MDGELLLYMLDGETLHWTSYRTGLKEETHFWSIHALEEDNRHRMILFVKDNSSQCYICLIEMETTVAPVMLHNLHSMTKQRIMCDVVINYNMHEME